MRNRKRKVIPISVCVKKVYKFTFYFPLSSQESRQVVRYVLTGWLFSIFDPVSHWKGTVGILSLLCPFLCLFASPSVSTRPSLFTIFSAPFSKNSQESAVFVLQIVTGRRDSVLKGRIKCLVTITAHLYHLSICDDGEQLPVFSQFAIAVRYITAVSLI